jgi:hypothetical protein
MRSYLVALVVALFALSPAAIAAETPFKRFLVPLYTDPVRGTFGSLWEVTTWFQYSGTETFEMIPESAVCAVLCTGPGELVSGSTAPLPLMPVFANESGVLMHVPRSHAAEMTFGSRVRDASRDLESAGTEVPVVPEDDMTSSPLYLLNVPVGPNARATLRIYALPEYPSPEVEVRYFRMPRRTPGGNLDGIGIILLRNERVQLRTYPATRPYPANQAYLLHPSFAAIANFETLPEILGRESVWIEVVPVTEGLPIWAFVSVTNNTTQQVTLVTPMRK